MRLKQCIPLVNDGFFFVVIGIAVVVVDIFAFHNRAQPYMENTDPPGWQTLIEGGEKILVPLTLNPAPVCTHQASP